LPLRTRPRIGGAEAEVDAASGGEPGQRLGELEAVAGLVAGQEQAADELVAHLRQRRLVADAAGPVEQLEGDAALAQDRDVVGAAVELLLGPEQLQGALHPLVVGMPVSARSAAGSRGCIRRAGPCAPC
jgi:hypothetical protein